MRSLKKLSILLLALMIVEHTAALVPDFVKGADAGETSARTQIDWASVDWNQKVILPKDLEEYERKRDELVRQGRTAELTALTPVRHTLSEDAVLETYNVPEEVRSLVAQNRETPGAKFTQSPRLTDGAPALVDAAPAQVLNISNGQKLLPQNANAIEAEGSPTLVLEKSTAASFPNPLYRVTLPGIIDFLGQGAGTAPQAQTTQTLSEAATKSNGVLGFLKGIFGIETAKAAPQNPLISYYQGIEKKTLDYALYYLSQQQNPDGSFGTFNPYEVTAEAVFMLSEVGRTANDQYQSALNYLLNTAPETNREKAMKARILVGLKEPHQPLLDEIIATKNTDGGYGLDAWYASDPQTTMEVALALSAANYAPKNEIREALWFTLNQIEQDGAMRYTETGNPSYYLMNRTAQYLLPFKALVLVNGQQTIKVQDKINSLLSYLSAHYDAVSATMTGTSDVIDSLMTIRTWRLYDVEKQKSDALRKQAVTQQSIDGSFDESSLNTVIALGALKEPDAVLVDLVSDGNLVNKNPAVLKLTVKNQGYAPLASVPLYGFVDGYFRADWNLKLFDQGDPLAPGDSAIYTIQLPGTIRFLGQTEFKFYLEPADDIYYDDNWISRQFAFAAALDSTPALPGYYVAHGHAPINNLPTVNVRWPHRTDPNRTAYSIVWRKKGDVNWLYSPVDNTWNGAYLSGPFVEGETYEITAGVVHKDGKTVTFFQDSTEVRVSTDSALYVGNANGFASDSSEALPNILTTGYNFQTSTDFSGNFALQKIQNGLTAAWVDAKAYEKLITSFPISIGGTTKNIRLFSRLKEDNSAPIILSVSIDPQNNFTVKNQKEVILTAGGSDNVALKEADFYLWDPKENIWTYLGTESANNQASVQMKWYVSADLLGPGYKIKAILRDFRGNESAQKEFGPFEFLDATPPLFTVVKPNGGETWALGTTENIDWTTKSVNGVDTVNLSVQYPNAGTTIKFGAPNTGSSSWTIPGVSNYAGDQVKIKVTGFDKGNFESSFDESDDFFQILDKSPRPPDPWGAAERMPTPYVSARSIQLNNPQMASDSKGVIHAVYRTVEDNLFVDPRLITERLYERKYTAGVWGPEEKIYEKVTKTDNDLTNYFPLLLEKIQFDAGDKLHLLFVQDAGLVCGNNRTREIYYAMFDGVVMSKPENVSSNFTDSVRPDFALDLNGAVHAAWMDGLTWDNNCNPAGSAKISYSSKSLNNAWLPAENFADGEKPDWPRIATINTEAHLLYANGAQGDVRHQYRSNGIWSAPKVIFQGSEYFPQLVSGSNKTLHTVFHQWYFDQQRGQGRSRILYLFYDGAKWLPAEEVSPVQDNYRAEYAKIALDARNYPHVVFELNDNRRKAVWTMKAQNQPWGAVQSVSPDSHNLEANSVSAAFISGTNTLAALWKSAYSLMPALFANKATFP